jgi:hypothetical protein
MNPTSSDHKATAENRSQQLNPESETFWDSRGGKKEK